MREFGRQGVDAVAGGFLIDRDYFFVFGLSYRYFAFRRDRRTFGLAAFADAAKVGDVVQVVNGFPDAVFQRPQGGAPNISVLGLALLVDELLEFVCAVNDETRGFTGG